MIVQLYDTVGPSTYPPLRGRADGVLAQLTRFTLAGTTSNALYALAFFTLDVYGSFLANLVGVATSSILANELHRRLTFRAADRVRWFVAQWEGGTLALIGLAVSSLALAWLHMAFPGADGLVQVALVVAVSAVVGGLRFLALRGWVFASTPE
ncbi:GtrA family protein [Rhodococcus tibetensis]|uniref:GtrA family protein n=1 Tax=Rhodococcus tibetensis TaxID=2965064 RepID=A0ABT1QF98_9NOCA|nr:GtrA family protein [Rhodococcus sp. FXJ9.536]MCQ4120926.1 GtrA family protein [Rhodococcus sp. FXJ9.536]